MADLAVAQAPRGLANPIPALIKRRPDQPVHIAGKQTFLEHHPGYRIQDDALAPCFCSIFSESRQPPFGMML
jgi:hypothetical protein